MEAKAELIAVIEEIANEAIRNYNLDRIDFRPEQYVERILALSAPPANAEGGERPTELPMPQYRFQPIDMTGGQTSDASQVYRPTTALSSPVVGDAPPLPQGDSGAGEPWPERDKDIAWLKRQKEAGHCGESTSDAIQRGRINARIDRLVNRLASPTASTPPSDPSATERMRAHQHQVGDPVTISTAYRYSEWHGVPLFVCGVHATNVYGEITYDLSENWPPKGHGDCTTDFPTEFVVARAALGEAQQ